MGEGGRYGHRITMLSKVDFIQAMGNGKDIIRWYSCSDIVIEGALDTEFDWHCISLVKGWIYVF